MDLGYINLLDKNLFYLFFESPSEYPDASKPSTEQNSIRPYIDNRPSGMKNIRHAPMFFSEKVKRYPISGGPGRLPVKLSDFKVVYSTI